ncbi:RsmB/NOP family class I SAM-dependent RNA methyltransferase, partial [Patescibacteria group bacterium]|nr:RsmB/NOP family class I SAM-dependent RNA methyltransferase [Patescibacteria group bacterium]
MDENQFKDYLSTFTDADKVLSTEIKPTIRINTLKIPKEVFFKTTKLKLKPTFYEFGFYSEDENSSRLGATWEYFLGYLHTQSLSSMLPSLILNPKQGDLILDAAAAPGSKTTHAAMLMQNKGAILANDVKWERASALFANIARLGVINTKVTVRDATKLGILKYFSKAFVDAPCSSLSQPFAYKKFTPNLSYELSKTQIKML